MKRINYVFSEANDQWVIDTGSEKVGEPYDLSQFTRENTSTSGSAKSEALSEPMTTQHMSLEERMAQLSDQMAIKAHKAKKNDGVVEGATVSL